MRKNNWFDDLFNDNHWDYAYAYAEVDPFYGKEEEETDDLSITVFHWRIGRFFRKVYRAVTKPIRVITGQDAAEKKAKQEAKNAQAEAERARKAYAEESARISKETAAAKEKYGAAKKEQEAQFAKSQEVLRGAKAKQEEAERVGTITAQYSQSKTQQAKQSTAEKAIADQKAVQAEALKAKRLGKQAKAPGISSVNIKGPGGVGGTGKAGSTTRSAKELRDKKKSALNI